ncbi:hypothetical protein GJAV_G00241340 [Gymnothorax javanicus]|nr:hypothetical protein GJAV_G00241340 [Gymnothorax javanicus]
MIKLLSTGANVLCRQLRLPANTLFSRGSCARARFVPAIQSFSTGGADGPPKVPATGYIRFLKQQQTELSKQYPDVKYVEITKKIAQLWQGLTPEQKKPFELEAQAAREKYKEELRQFYACLSPEQVRALKEMKRQKLERRKTIRMKRELTVLGKPKRPRTSFNIFMSEHFLEAKGTTMQAKMKSLVDDWATLHSSLKQTYENLARDDRVRYAQEMESWEKYMTQIGREDLIRRKAARKTKEVDAEGAKPKTKNKAAQTDMTIRNATKKSTRKLKRPEE